MVLMMLTVQGVKFADPGDVLVEFAALGDVDIDCTTLWGFEVAAPLCSVDGLDFAVTEALGEVVGVVVVVNVVVVNVVVVNVVVLSPNEEDVNCGPVSYSRRVL